MSKRSPEIRSSPVEKQYVVETTFKDFYSVYFNHLRHLFGLRKLESNILAEIAKYTEIEGFETLDNDGRLQIVNKLNIADQSLRNALNVMRGKNLLIGIKDETRINPNILIPLRGKSLRELLHEDGFTINITFKTSE